MPRPSRSEEFRIAISGLRFRIIAVASSESDDSPTTFTAGDFLKALLESVAKVDICVCQDDSHAMVSTGVIVSRVMHSL